ncbi:unnamed protein product [Ilex paraguariensis]|uniref:Large ribosomal subunit protein uL15/eL18 domain-containing protein n=1 Tax=Ilex paraguariensis TaxID=185542 RepID=A0ABC8V546_9AQUA
MAELVQGFARRRQHQWCVLEERKTELLLEVSFRNKFFYPTININKLWLMVPQDMKDKANQSNVPMIDVTQFGYVKVLGKGVLPSDQPMVVKVSSFPRLSKRNLRRLVVLWFSPLRSSLLLFDFVC